jgi:pimeloyl-ACP methyl ester carboxylesterase
MTMSTLDPGAGLTEGAVRLPDGRTLRTVVAGEGGPLVVFEAGMGASAGEWVCVQRLVAERTATLSYDRAGHGGSDDDPQPRSLERLAEDLVGLLDAQSPAAPVVLVGHSWGGPVIRLVAQRHPERVAGLVLVDATVTEVMSPRAARMSGLMFGVFGAVAAVGVHRPLMRRYLEGQVSPDVSAADREVLQREFLSRRSLRTAAREARGIAPALPLLGTLQDEGLPAVPVASVYGARVGRGEAKVRPRFIDVARTEMERHPHGWLVLVESGHLVPQEQPLLTASAVLDVVGAARTA